MRNDPLAQSAPLCLDAYQEQGAAFLAGDPAGTARLLADEPGLGKTPQAIRAADMVEAKRVLVVAPAIAIENWARETSKWQNLQRPVTVLYRGSTPINGVNIVSYDRLVSDLPTFAAVAALEWDVLILDEAHYVRTPAAKRTKKVYGPRLDGSGLVSRAKRVWLLTGTPTPNYVHELYTHLRALWPDKISVFDKPMTEFQFMEAFCQVKKTIYGPQVTGNRNIPRLREMLKDVAFRRTWAQVKTDMPPLRLNTVTLPVDPRTVPWTELGLHDAAPPPTDDADAMLAWMRANFTHLSRLRETLARVKATSAAEYVNSLLDSGVPKVVVFAHHRRCIEIVAEHLGASNPVVITGDTPPAKRDQHVNTFQTDPDCRVALGNITAMGTAVTLTAANRVVFVEASWVPGENVQAAKRCHRYGQTLPVLAQFLTVPDSVDEDVMDTLVHKARQTKTLWNKETKK